VVTNFNIFSSTILLLFRWGTTLLYCPASEPLRRAIFGSTSSIVDRWSRPWAWPYCWVSVGLHALIPW